MNIELAGPVRASFLLQKLAIEEACAMGCRYYHFGETGRNAGLARFKSQFGAVEFCRPDFYFERIPIAQAVDRGRELARRASRAGR
jgi:lipid II:glycine glycyltransferase (peptidoglycan interpeptide bridge formation enzyme)